MILLVNLLSRLVGAKPVTGSAAILAAPKSSLAALDSLVKVLAISGDPKVE